MGPDTDTPISAAHTALAIEWAAIAVRAVAGDHAAQQLIDSTPHLADWQGQTTATIARISAQLVPEQIDDHDSRQYWAWMCINLANRAAWCHWTARPWNGWHYLDECIRLAGGQPPLALVLITDGADIDEAVEIAALV